MLKQKVFELINLVVEQYGGDQVEITENSHFADDLGMDSLDTIELIMEIENNFGVRIPEELEGAERVSDLLDFLEGAEGLMIPDEVRLTLYGQGEETPKTEKFAAPNVKKMVCLSDDEVQEIDQDLHSKIDAYVNEHLANWTEMCECEEEGDALEFFLDRHLPSWRVRNDGTIDVIVEGDSRERFEFDWEDEEGEERTSNALDLLQGNVSHEFDEDCNNEFVWERDLESQVKGLFQ
jgi:acyl carrier protein